MTFPCVELKFSRILRTAAQTSVLVRLYRVDDGGRDPLGNQGYVRTRIRERLLTLEAGMDTAQVLTEGQARLAEWAVASGFTLTPDRLLCSL